MFWDPRCGARGPRARRGRPRAARRAGPDAIRTRARGPLRPGGVSCRVSLTACARAGRGQVE